MRDFFSIIFSDPHLRKEYDRYVSSMKLAELKNALFSSNFSYMFLGGFMGEIGRSMVIFNFNGSLVLVDAGVKPARDPWLKYPALDIIKELNGYISAVFITHVHADHVGLLPALIRLLKPDTKIYMTDLSLSILPVLLNDMFNIVQKGDSELFLIERPNEFPSWDDIKNDALSRVVPLSYGQVLSFQNFSVRVLNANHIYGSASYLFQAKSGLKILYSGDIGSKAEPAQTDILFLESTYGSKDHAPYNDEYNRFISDIRATLSSGNPVFVPTFALGRAQDILSMVFFAMNSGAIPKVDVFVGGLAYSIARSMPTIATLPFKGIDAMGSASGPKIVIVSSNNMVSGVSSEYAVDFITIPSLIAITGYQDNETPARILYSQKDAGVVDLFGYRYQKRCRIESYDFSAHAGRSDLISYAMSTGAKQVVLMHGDLGSASSLLQALNSKGTKAIPSRFMTVCSDKREIAGFSNYWGIFGGNASDFYCLTCNGYLQGYRNALLHNFFNKGHNIISTNGHSIIKITAECNDNLCKDDGQFRALALKLYDDLHDNNIKFSSSWCYLKTRKGKFGYAYFYIISDENGKPSPDEVNAILQYSINSIAGASGSGNNGFKVSITQPMPIKSTPVIEY
ncbi:MAG: MBL fold metallo-hydrolase, partial [Thermoplasmata archaeon]